MLHIYLICCSLDLSYIFCCRKHSSKSLSQPTIPEEGPEHEEGVVQQPAAVTTVAAQPSFTSKILAAVSGKNNTANDRSQAVKTPPTGTKVNYCLQLNLKLYYEGVLHNINFD